MWPFVVMFLVGGLALYFAGRAQERYALRARSWPVVAGKLEQCEVVDVPDVQQGQPGSWDLCLRYAYVVRGRVHHGSRYAIGYPSTFDDAPHRRIAERLRNLPELSVHYDPVKPEDAVLSTDSYTGATKMGSFGVLMAGVSALLALLHFCIN